MLSIANEVDPLIFRCVCFVCDTVEDCFFDPRGITSLATYATSIYYYFLGKSI